MISATHNLTLLTLEFEEYRLKLVVDPKLVVSLYGYIGMERSPEFATPAI